MARNSKQTSALEAKALKLDNKSEGMRMLFDAGYSVVQVKTVFSAPYGYVYGVAQRHGVAETAATRRVRKEAVKASPKAAKVTKPAVKVTPAVKAAVKQVLRSATKAVEPVKRGRGRPRKDGTPAQPSVKPVAKVATASKPSTAAKANGASAPKANGTSAVARVAARLAAKAPVKPGRPSPERRQLNRSPRHQSVAAQA